MSEKTEESRRRSARLKGYDYSQPGAYFVTMCVWGMAPTLSEIMESQVVFTQVGKIAESCWNKMGDLKARIDPDEYVIMPNHLHGILFIHNPSRGEAFEGRFGSVRRRLPSNASPVHISRGTVSGSLGAIIQNFKSISTRKINRLNNTPGKTFWQRGYYDRIIRNHEELDRIRKYIFENPLKWELDEYHPSKLKNS